jgi:urease accessory protein
MSLIPLLLLADSRLPAGAHAHSGGLEAAVAAGRVRDAETLRVFLLGRLGSAGLTAAAFAAAAASQPTADRLALLDAEYEARTPSPVQRDVSRTLGSQLLQVARAGWPGPAVDAAAAVHPQGPHQPVAFGASAAAAGVDEYETAAAAALASVTGPAGAAARLLILAPEAVTAALAGLSAQVHLVATAAARVALGPAEDLPSVCALALDISAEQHATWEVRLFAS